MEIMTNPETITSTEGSDLSVGDFSPSSCSADWIACETRLPAHGQHVWFCQRGQVKSGTFSTEHAPHFNPGRLWHPGNGITHWKPMIIPTPPNAEVSHRDRESQAATAGPDCAESTGYALFAFGHYYPNGGIGDLRGRYATVEECRAAFVDLGPTLMREQGYGSGKPGGNDCTGQIVNLKTLRCVETLRA